MYKEGKTILCHRRRFLLAGVPQAIIPEIGSGCGIVRPVTLGAVSGITTLAARDDIRWPAVVAAIVVRVVGVVVVSVVSAAVAVSKGTTNSQAADKRCAATISAATIPIAIT